MRDAIIPALKIAGYYLLMNLITIALLLFTVAVRELIESRPLSWSFPPRIGVIALFISNLSYILGFILEYLSARWFDQEWKALSDPFRYARISLILVGISIFTSAAVYFI